MTSSIAEVRAAADADDDAGGDGAYKLRVIS